MSSNWTIHERGAEEQLEPLRLRLCMPSVMRPSGYDACPYCEESPELVDVGLTAFRERVKACPVCERRWTYDHE